MTNIAPLNTGNLSQLDAFAYAQSTTFEDLPDAAKLHIDQEFLKQHFLKHRQHEFKKRTFDRDETVDVWLSLKASTHTRRRYQAGVKEFFAFLDNVAKVHLLDLDADTVDRYIAYIMRRFKASSTQHSYLDVASAFCVQLVRRGDLAANYFAGADRPKRMGPKMLYVPEAHEVEALLDIASQSNATWRVPALRFMLRTGCRVGLFNGLTLVNGMWTGISKEKPWIEPYQQDDARLVDVLPINSGTLRNAVDRMVSRLLQQGQISAKFSVHDLRRFCAKREYQRTKDIEYVRKFLHHKDISTTQKYLRENIGVSL